MGVFLLEPAGRSQAVEALVGLAQRVVGELGEGDALPGFVVKAISSWRSDGLNRTRYFLLGIFGPPGSQRPQDSFHRNQVD